MQAMDGADSISERGAAADEDVASLARELGRAYAEQLRFHLDHVGESVDRTDLAVRPDDPRWADRVHETPAAHLSWYDFAAIAERDPELAVRTWHRVKQEARAELMSGQRAALALDRRSDPWERARFLAIRQGFIDEWQPRGGIEFALIDQMTSAHAQYLSWLDRLNDERMNRALLPGGRERGTPPYDPPRVTSAQAVEEAAAMAERFQRLFVRAVRTLRDLRRFTPSVVVQNACQVNLAHQQVNTTSATPEV